MTFWKLVEQLQVMQEEQPFDIEVNWKDKIINIKYNISK